jgi:hypothetical protein
MKDIFTYIAMGIFINGCLISLFPKVEIYSLCISALVLVGMGIKFLIKNYRKLND